MRTSTGRGRCDVSSQGKLRGGPPPPPRGDLSCFGCEGPNPVLNEPLAELGLRAGWRTETLDLLARCWGVSTGDLTGSLGAPPLSSPGPPPRDSHTQQHWQVWVFWTAQGVLGGGGVESLELTPRLRLGSAHRTHRTPTCHVGTERRQATRILMYVTHSQISRLQAIVPARLDGAAWYPPTDSHPRWRCSGA